MFADFTYLHNANKLPVVYPEVAVVERYSGSSVDSYRNDPPKSSLMSHVVTVSTETLSSAFGRFWESAILEKDS